MEIKTEQLWILTILVHVKTGAIIVTCSSQIKMFLNYAWIVLIKRCYFFFKTKCNFTEKLLMNWHVSISMRILIWSICCYFFKYFVLTYSFFKKKTFTLTENSLNFNGTYMARKQTFESFLKNGCSEQLVFWESMRFYQFEFYLH